jgi:alkanesulfonate monooxygenase
MSVEFIGMIGTQYASETHAPKGPAIDIDYVRDFVLAHEQSGFDRILVGYFSNGPDGFVVASYAAFVSRTLGLMLAHRPGFVAPTLAARKLATLDHFSGGRLAVHIISGGDDLDQRKDGDFLPHDARYQRTDEYVGILRRIWTTDRPIDHRGRYYRFEQAFSAVKPAQKPYIPIYFGGASDAAIEVAAKHADIYALWGEPLAEAAQTIARVRAAAARNGRSVRFSLSLRPILAPTEAEAWSRARRIIDNIRQTGGRAMLGPAAKAPQNVGSQRLLAAAAAGEVLDQRLWTAVAAATGARGNTTALVGTPTQVAESLLAYYDLGVTTFLIRGFDPLEDARDCGRELIPIVRAEVAARDRSRSAIRETRSDHTGPSAEEESEALPTSHEAAKEQVPR